MESQIIICYHMDYCKLSHRKNQANYHIIKCRRKEYEIIFEDGIGKMSANRKNIHTYLGMNLDYSTLGQVKINIFDYIEEIITSFLKVEPDMSNKTK